MIDTVPGKSVLFLDFDDVIALGKPYGGHHLLQSPQPDDIHLRLWHKPAMDAVLEVIAQARPYVVLTTTWLRFLDLASARELFRKTNAMPLAEHLHPLGGSSGTPSNPPASDRFLDFRPTLVRPVCDSRRRLQRDRLARFNP